MTFKTLVAAAALIAAPALLPTTASAADYDGHRYGNKWSNDRYDRHDRDDRGYRDGYRDGRRDSSYRRYGHNRPSWWWRHRRHAHWHAPRWRPRWDW